MWLAEAGSFLAGQKATAESADVTVLQERQKKLKVKKPQNIPLHSSNCLVQIGHDIHASNPFSLRVQEVQQDLQARREGVAEAIRSVEDLLADKGDSLSPQERQNLQVALTRMKEQYSALAGSVHTSLSDVDTAITTAVHQNMQKVNDSGNK